VGVEKGKGEGTFNFERIYREFESRVDFGASALRKSRKGRKYRSGKAESIVQKKKTGQGGTIG